ncbi:spore coat protein JB [Natranaerovirga pectinivora]|uniref:Spore coat protein JB n=1 Tax=Natranaerovirga pectinivora TaxID=682400 RepID=A0A4R3MP07_9FIRM|nr:spore coat protein CotJB [Natranaerovirga pectinivora]TCT16290.1 spore coat protein JB [Natranaerovirga pectinivora]
MNKHLLLREIQELEFAGIELNLYLDTHPDCERALMDYNMISKELNKKKRMYEMHYGPLTNFAESPSQFPFAWVDGPWPWENKC